MRKHRTTLAVIFIALWLPACVAIFSLLGCDTTKGRAPYPLNASTYTTITNTVTTAAGTAGAIAPTPLVPIIEATAAAILALLAAWQGLTHKRVVEVEKLLTQAKKVPPS